MKKKLAIIGANYLQKPLVEKAEDMGIETHLFAWQKGAVAAPYADFFYPISVLDRESILEICKEIKIDGITSVGSDTVMPTVNYVASEMGLVGNSLESTLVSTNKFEMRKRLIAKGIPCPKFKIFHDAKKVSTEDLSYPVIVKPVDRSGSIGVSKVDKTDEVNSVLSLAIGKSFIGQAIVEEFIEGREFSVEMISVKGQHHFITVTEKVTTGAPYYVEIAHHQPAPLTLEQERNIVKTVKRSLDALELENGASHSEVFLTKKGEVMIVEIAGRMGGCFIGSHMVPYSTGFDFLKAVVQISLGIFEINLPEHSSNRHSGVYYVIPPPGRIDQIEDRSSGFSDIRHVEILKAVGDIISETTDGPDNRSAIMVYAGNKKLDLNPEDVVKFSMSDINCAV